MPKQQDSLHLRLAAGKTLDSTESKSRLLEMIAKGFSVEDACKAVGKSSKTFYYYTKSDPDFDREVKLVRALKPGVAKFLTKTRVCLSGIFVKSL
jgi:hypothetical protein